MCLVELAITRFAILDSVATNHARLIAGRNTLAEYPPGLFFPLMKAPVG